MSIIRERDGLAQTSCEARKEGVRCVADQISEMLDCFNDRFTINNPRFFERYVKAEAHLLIWFSIRGSDEKFIAYLERAEVIGRSDESLNIGRRDSHFPKHLCGNGAEIHASETCAYGNEQAVLVDIVKGMQPPEIVPLPSLIWFERAERVLSVLPYSLYFSGKKGYVSLGVVFNEEVDFVRSFATTPSSQKKLIGKVIEAASEVLDDVPGNGSQINRGGFSLRYIIDQFTRLRIALSSDLIGSGVLEGVDCSIEIMEGVAATQGSVFDWRELGAQVTPDRAQRLILPLRMP